MTHDYDSAPYVQLTSTWNNDPTAYLSRYYSLYYKLVDKQSDPGVCHVYVRQSPNKISVLGIHEEEIINKVHSIHMHRELIGQKVKKDTILSELKDQEGQLIGIVKAQMEGKLLELNTRLDEEQGHLLLKSYYMDTAFFAIIMPKSEDTDIQLKGYLTAEEYTSQLKK